MLFFSWNNLLDKKEKNSVYALVIVLKTYLNSVNPANIHVTMRHHKCLNGFVIARHSKRDETTNKTGRDAPKTPHLYVKTRHINGASNVLLLRLCNILTDFLIIVRFMHVTWASTLKRYGCL